MRPMPVSVLVNYMEFANVGHVIEALRYALAYHAADRSREIGLLVPSNSPWELAAFCPFVHGVYPVSPQLSDLPGSLEEVPRTWDWIVDNPRRHDPVHVAAWDGLDRWFATTDRELEAQRGRGVIGAEPPSYTPHQQLRLELPTPEREAAGALLEGAPVRIAVMPTGSRPRWQYPSTASWLLILHALRELHPGVRFCLLGKLCDHGRTRSSLTAAELARLRDGFPDAVDGFDHPIAEQVALSRHATSSSPPTGFGMAARGRDTLAHPLRRILARVLLQRRPLLLPAPLPGAIRPVHPVHRPADARRRHRRRRLTHTQHEPRPHQPRPRRATRRRDQADRSRLSCEQALQLHVSRLLRIVDRTHISTFEGLHHAYV